MKNFLLGSFVLLLIFSFGESLAQQRTVSGKVTAVEDGSVLPGVNVVVKGTTNGTVTDIDGNYSVNVGSEGATLVFSFIGLISEEVEIGTRSTIDVQMSQDVKQLSEVVVVGYGTTTKQSFAGSMKEVDSDLIQRKSVANVSQALAGEVSGVRIVNTSGQPGTTATVRIRGIGSVNGNSDPLYVLDGVPYYGSINAINPADIESVTVLKDATATAIYGSRGANGVILVNTKKGKAGKGFIEVNAKYGQNMNLLPRYETISSPEEYIGLSWEALYNKGVLLGAADPEAYANSNLFSRNGINTKYNMWNVADGSELIDPTTGAVRPGVTRKYDPEDWEDYAFQNSDRKEGNIRIGGGDQKVNYFTSFGYLKDIGYSINSDYERYSARLNLNHQVKEWLSGGLNIGYSRSETNNGGQSDDSGSIFWFVDNIPSIYPLFLRDDDGNTIPDPYYGGNVYDYGDGRGFAGLTNSISDASITVQNRVSHDLNGNASLNVDIIDGLRFESRYGWQYYNSSYDQLESPYYGPSATASANGSIYKTKTEIFNYNFTNLLRYNKEFGDHGLELIAAHENSKWDRKFLTGYKQQLLDPFGNVEFDNAVVNQSSTSYAQGYSIESYFGQANYNFKNTYYLTGSIRRDGSSRFVKDKWGTFGAVGMAWVLSNESFLQGQKVFDFLKLKTSYGITGDQAGVGYYPGTDLYSIGIIAGTPTTAFDTRGNPDLTWETAKMFQAGLEFSLGKYLDGSFDYYNKLTDNLIFDRRVPPSLGYAIIKVNDGKLRNSGLEFDLTGHLIKNEDFYLDLRVNGEILNNKLLNNPIDPATGQEKIIQQDGNYGRQAGHSIYDYYMREWAGVDPANGEGLWNVYYEDLNSNGAYDSGEEVGDLETYKDENPNAVLDMTTTSTYSRATQSFVGKSAIPDVRGALNLSAGYKNFDLTVLFLYSLGGYAYDNTYAGLMDNDQVGGNNWHVDIRDRWQQEGDVTDVPRLSSDFGNDSQVNSVSTRFLTKADYFTLSNVRLGYTIPTAVTKRIGVNSFNVFIAGDNLFLLSKRDGFNPTTSITGASSTYTYSPLSTLTVGANIKF